MSSLCTAEESCKAGFAIGENDARSSVEGENFPFTSFKPFHSTIVLLNLPRSGVGKEVRA